MSSRRFRSWAHLKGEGLAIYGEIFPNGLVPIQSIIGQEMILGGQNSKAYMVFLPEITDEQLNGLCQIFESKSGNPRDKIKAEILKRGMPLRVELTSGFLDVRSPDGLALFIKGDTSHEKKNRDYKD